MNAHVRMERAHYLRQEPENSKDNKEFWRAINKIFSGENRSSHVTIFLTENGKIMWEK